jgi:hypothetical protein
MNTEVAAIAVALSFAATFGAVVPWLAMRYLARGLSGTRIRVANYRGVDVAPTLGLVWIVWAVALLVGQVLLEVVSRSMTPTGPVAEALERVASTPLALPLFGVPFLLVAGAFALGLADDAFGADGPKGFRGHLGRLRRGELTTGLVKLLGICGLALFYGATAASGILERSGITGQAAYSGWRFVGTWLTAASVIALSANLMNLLDLRPGRALKVYGAVVVGPAIAFSVKAIESYALQVEPFAGEIGGLALTSSEETATAIAVVLVLLGPVFAVWRYDVSEQGMLGDAGANTMGAIVGYLLTAVLPFGWLAAVAAVLLALNVTSERVSFTRVIEATPPLAWLDRLGRHHGEQRTTPESPGGEARAPSVRYHSDEEAARRED